MRAKPGHAAAEAKLRQRSEWDSSSYEADQHSFEGWDNNFGGVGENVRLRSLP